MSEIPYRKVRVLLNTKTPRFSKVIDLASGEEIPVSDVQINIGHSTRFSLKVQFTMEDPFVEVVLDAPDDPLGVGAIVQAGGPDRP